MTSRIKEYFRFPLFRGGRIFSKGGRMMGKRKAVIFAFCCGAVVLLTACGQSSQELAKTPGEYVKRAEELILSG